jgi:hypothetical protein
MDVRFEPWLGIAEIFHGPLLVGDGVGVLGEDGQDVPTVGSHARDQADEPGHRSDPDRGIAAPVFVEKFSGMGPTRLLGEEVFGS